MGRDTTRRSVLGAAGALAGGLLAGQGVSEAKQRNGKRKNRQSRRKRTNAEVAIDSYAKLCAVLPSRLRARCLAEAEANQVACECSSFCVRLHPRMPLKQLACLRKAEDPQSSLRVACDADPDRACAQGDSIICLAEGQCCDNSDCQSPNICKPDRTCGSTGGGSNGDGSADI